MENQYREEIENKIIDKIDTLCSELPNYVMRFERSLQQYTEVKTRYAYVNDIKNFLEYLAEELECDVKNITLEQIENCNKDFFEDYLNYLQKYKKNGKIYTNGRASMKRKMSSLKKFYSYLFKSDLIKTVNIEKIDMPKLKKKEIVYMDSDEVKDFLNTVKSGKLTGSNMEEKYNDILGYRNTVISNLLLMTGIRVSELVGLNINDVDLKNSRIRVIRKGNKEDYVYYNNDMNEMLSEYLEYRKSLNVTEKDKNALFISTRQTRLSVRSVEDLVKKYGRKAVPLKNIHCHSTRSSFAMEFLKNSNGDIEGLQSALGHNNIATTQFYARSTQDMKKSKKEIVNFTKNDE